MSEKISEDTIRKTYNWTKRYGELEKGEYQFKLAIPELISFNIKIDFTIDENAKILYDEPNFE